MAWQAGRRWPTARAGLALCLAACQAKAAMQAPFPGSVGSAGLTFVSHAGERFKAQPVALPAAAHVIYGPHDISYGLASLRL